MKKIKEWFRGHGVMYWHHYGNDVMGIKYPEFRIRPMFAWFDFWVGVFVDRKNRQIYVFPLPMIGFQIGYQPGKLQEL